MNDHRQRVVEAVERFAVRAMPCDACGSSPASVGWRRGGVFGHWCSHCARVDAGVRRVPWAKPAPPPWRGPTSGDAA